MSAELETLQQSREKQSHGITLTEALRNLSRREIRTPFLIILASFYFSLFTGPFAIIFYAVEIFKEAGVASNEHLAAIITALVRIGKLAKLRFFFAISKLNILSQRRLANSCQPPS